jgi:uncharacterized protein
MTVVADTTPIRHLVAIGLGYLLERLYGRLSIPTRVWMELNDESTPAIVSDWLRGNRDWISVESPLPEDEMHTAMDHLHQGEREAIQLAIQISADTLLMDDRAGREVAASLGLGVIGTLGILEEADRQGFVDSFPDVLDRLLASRFYVSKALLQHLLARHLERKGS